MKLAAALRPRRLGRRPSFLLCGMPNLRPVGAGINVQLDRKISKCSVIPSQKVTCMHSFCRGIAGLVLLATAGCAGANYAMNDFNGIDPVAWQSPMSGSTFLIFDKPQEARLLIARNSGETNLQDGIANPAPIATDTSPASYESATIEWLKTTGRTCMTKSTFLIAEFQYEIRYLCEGPFPAAPAKPAPW